MDNLIITNKDKIIIVNFDDIISLNACGRYTTIVTEEKEYVACRNLGLYKKELPERFFRIHKSCIINIEKILSISCKKILMSSGHTYKIANGRKMETINYIYRFRKDNS